MIKTKKSKKKRVGLILCSLFICLCSILCIVPFNQEQKHVSADSVISESPVFESTRIWINTARYSKAYNVNTQSIIHQPLGVANNGNGSYYTPVDFSFLNTFFKVSFRYNQSNGDIEFCPSFDYINVYDFNNIQYGEPVPSNSGGYFMSKPYTSLNLFTNTFSGYQFSLNNEWLNLRTWSVNDSRLIISQNFTDYNSYVPGSPEYTGPSSIDTPIDGLLVKIVLSVNDIDIAKINKMTISLDNTASSTNESFFNVCYYDTLNNYVSFRFYCGSWRFNLDTRTYYFNNNFDFTDNEYYNQGYQQGQQNGYNTGYNAGESAGYNEGYSVGQTTGYNNGYSDGMEDSNQYTFLNLLSATIDAPVKYFQSLFNFELLGVNLQGFLTGLFTLCVIVTIVKLCLGG